MHRLSLVVRSAAVVSGLVLAAGSSVACSISKGGTAASSSDGLSTTDQTDTDVASAPSSKDDPGHVLHRALVADAKLDRFAFDLRFGLVLGPQDEQFHISGRIDRTDDASQISAEANGQQTVELRTVGDTAWLQSTTPAFLGAMPAGKSWAKGSVRTLLSQGAITPVNQTVAVLYYLEGANHIRAKGREKLDGVAVTHYAFAVDRQRAEDKAPAGRKAEVHRLMTANGSTRLSITGEVWLDAHERVRRMVAHGALTSGSPPDSADSEIVPASGHIDYELRQRNFGGAVTVDRPPADATVDIDATPGLVAAFKQSQSTGSDPSTSGSGSGTSGSDTSGSDTSASATSS